jgi:predicted Rossmann fold flavoprotein
MANNSADIIIIGGGAAGLMAAAGAAQTYASRGISGRVIILEKMPRPGRKIMITGKGRCNFTNLKQWNEFSGHIHPKPNFLKPSFYNLTSEKMIDFLESHDMETVVERGDRAFPASHLSSEVVDTLVKAAQDAGAELICNKEVSEIVRNAEDTGFNIRCVDGAAYTCGKVIICTGGLSYPKTGSTGDGYRWAESMGHSIRPLFPSLTAMVPEGYKTSESGKEAKGHIDRSTPISEIGRSLCGNQLKNVGLSLIIDGNEVQNEFGDLDFTDGGIEGPIGFKVSRRCVNAIINGSKVTAVIDLKPAVEYEDLYIRIGTLWNEVSKDKRNSNKLYKDRFKLLLPKVLPMSLIPAFTRLNPNVDHKTLAKALKNWKMDIVGYVGYERCVITAGGVNLDEVTAKTLESKLIPGLYFAGEVLDLDADTGGYNLQTAFSTGYLAGISAAR